MNIFDYFCFKNRSMGPGLIDENLAPSSRGCGLGGPCLKVHVVGWVVGDWPKGSLSPAPSLQEFPILHFEIL